MSEKSSISSSWRSRDWRLGMRVRGSHVKLGDFTPVRDSVIWSLRTGSVAPDNVLRLAESTFKWRIVVLQNAIVNLIGANMQHLAILIAMRDGHVENAPVEDTVGTTPVVIDE